MKLLQLIKLSHADFKSRKKVITFSVLAAGIPFILLLAVHMIAAGAQNVMINEASKASNGEVYLAITGNNPKSALEEALSYDGEIIKQITPTDAAKYETTTELLKDIPELKLNSHLLDYDGDMFSGKEFLGNDNFLISKDGFHLSTMFLNPIATYYAPFYGMSNLQESLNNNAIYLVKFPNVQTAYTAYRNSTCYKLQQCSYSELGNNLFESYHNYQQADGLDIILQITFIIIAVIILIGTYVYLLDQSMHSMVIYRAVGANTFDLIVISFWYLLEVSVAVIIYSLAASLIIALLISGIDASYITKLFTDFYGSAPSHTMLIGFNLQMLWIILAILICAPCSLLLTLDQFSVKRLSRKLKRD